MTDRTDPRPRGDAERIADHAAIGRLADDLLPALVAKLAASGLGEIEVREGDWHVRLRMPAGEPDRGPSRRAGAPVRSGAGGPGTAPHAGDAAAGAAAAGATPPETTSGRGRGTSAATADGGPGSSATSRPRAVATSPAVGIFRVRQGVSAGSRVRAGDRIGVVDVLGVPHDVLAPEDGIVGSSYVDDGEGVEYGQELVRIEPSEPARPAEPARPDPAHAEAAR